ncbi:MAG: exodeoxyribonuclease V subunit beta [Gammaproteobacteria bacterium]
MDIHRFEAFDAVNTELSAGINLIEASAGTGKTFAIAMLALRFIVEQGLPIEQLLIVTFTKAATEELKERIRARLAGAKRALEGQGAGDDAVLTAWLDRLAVDTFLARQRLQLALLDIDRAGIFTIHGFCQRVLNEHALESGQVFDAELSGDLHALRRQIAADFWRLHVAAAAPHVAALFIAQCATPDALLLSVGNLADDVPVFPGDGDVPTALAELQGAAQSAWEALPKAAAALDSALAGGYFKSDYSENFAARAQALQAWLQAFLQLPEEVAAPSAGSGSAVCVVPAVDLLSRQTLLDSLNGNKFKTTGSQSGAQRKQQYLAESGIDTTVFDALESALKRLGVAFRCAFLHYLRRERDQQLRELNLLSFDDLIGRLADALRGEAAEWLQQTLRQRYKSALIDEFQDTDQQQWHIFSMLFGHGEAYLYLIGDPKQAIYKFRGADIFSYFEAQQQAQRHFTLEKNWRSQPLLVDAVNALFARSARPFWFDELHFIKVQAGVSEARQEFFPVLQLWQLPPSGTKDGYWSAGKARQAVQAEVVDEILRLLRRRDDETSPLSQTGRACVHPHHIAILVRSNQAAREYREALQAAGVAAVLNNVESVFTTQEARELYVLLQALAYPGEATALKQALTLPWFDLDGQTLYRLGNDAAELDEWLLRFHDYHRLWLEKGVMAMMMEVMRRENVRAHLACCGNAERQIANIQHVLELLQQACIEEHLGLLKSLDWLRAAIADAAHHNADDRQLRLESDAQAVQIVTLHRSKGLEYPLVFCPDLWQRSDRLSQETLLIECHEDGRRIADFGSAQFEARRARALQEELAEDLRIAYVALTRAQYRCYLVWADVRSKEWANGSALAYLLFSEGGEKWREGLKDFDFAAQQRQLLRFCTQSPGFAYRLLAANENTAATPDNRSAVADGEAKALSARVRSRNLYTDWQMSSYTALSALSQHDAPELPEDKAQEPQLSLPLFEQETLEGGYALPKGAHTGNVVHALLETQDFSLLAAGGDIGAARQQVCLRYGLTLDEPHQLDALLQTVVKTPLAADDADFCLANIAGQHCLKEMPFYLPLPRLDTASINAVLQDCPAFQPLQPKQLQGFLTGFIDLVCLYQGRYYVMDYKTNSLDDYRPVRLTAAMREHNYGLQYWLYTLVLHRYLQNRQADYDYQRHFGGVRYLFVRGMAPQRPMQGVYQDRPEYERIQMLDGLFF